MRLLCNGAGCVCLLVLTSLPGCVGTTGGELLTLEGYATGTPAAASFENGRGYRVKLTEARLFVGGVYLNRARATSVSSETSCTLNGVYVAELLGGAEVDLLSSQRQPFPDLGFATSERAQTAEVWLTRGDVNAPDDSGPLLRVAGSAERDGQHYNFSGVLSIGPERVPEPIDPALPGQYPICKQRIVTPIPVDLALRERDALRLEIDARAMFANVDFKTLEPAVGADGDGERVFADSPGIDQASDNLYAGMRSSAAYRLSAVHQGSEPQ
jgi:hypothetical protein